jgi:hypothetical protein
MVLTGDLLEGPELDRIDDELFATDYRLPSQRRHLTVLPEPPTVRFRYRPPAEPTAAGGSPRQVVVAGEIFASDPESAQPWPTYAASPYSEDENGTEIIALIGFAVLLVVGVAAAVVVVIWWA